MDLQGALKETPSTGIMVGRRRTSLRKSESMYSIENKSKIHTLMLDNQQNNVKLITQH